MSTISLTDIRSKISAIEQEEKRIETGFYKSYTSKQKTDDKMSRKYIRAISVVVKYYLDEDGCAQGNWFKDHTGINSDLKDTFVKKFSTTSGFNETIQECVKTIFGCFFKSKKKTAEQLVNQYNTRCSILIKQNYKPEGVSPGEEPETIQNLQNELKKCAQEKIVSDNRIKVLEDEKKNQTGQAPCNHANVELIPGLQLEIVNLTNARNTHAQNLAKATQDLAAANVNLELIPVLQLARDTHAQNLEKATSDLAAANANVALIPGLQLDIVNLTKARDTHAQNLATATQDLAAANANVALIPGLQLEIANLTNEKAVLVARIEELEKRPVPVIVRPCNHESKIQDLENQLKNEIALREKIAQKNGRLKTRCAELIQQREDDKKLYLEKLNSYSEFFKTKIAEIQSSKDAISAELQAVRDKYTSEKLDFSERLQSFQATMQRVSEENERLKLANTSFEEKREDLTNQIEALRKSLAEETEAKRQLSEQNPTSRNYESELQVANGKIDELKEALGKVEFNYQALLTQPRATPVKAIDHSRDLLLAAAQNVAPSSPGVQKNARKKANALKEIEDLKKILSYPEVKEDKDLLDKIKTMISAVDSKICSINNDNLDTVKAEINTLMITVANQLVKGKTIDKIQMCLVFIASL